MGFWDTVGKVAKGAVSAAGELGKQYAADVEKHKTEYRSESSGMLRTFLDAGAGSPKERAAARAVLRERGEPYND